MDRKVTIMGAIGASVFVLIMAPTALAGHSCGSKAATAKAANDIVDTAASAGDFETLVTAIKAAGLTETLKGEGPFTVFAPTDAAFAKLPKGTVESLLKDLPKLRSILKYHVVAGAVKAADVSKLQHAKTVLGQQVEIDTSKGVRINDATVTAADIEAKNGVIHVIDTVLLPKDDIIDLATKAGEFETLVTAIRAAGLTDTLRGEGPFTVFAPTDEAFAQLPDGTLDSLLKDTSKLRSILTYHVVPGRVLAADVVKLRKAKTVQGEHVSIDASSGVRINEATVVKTDIEAGNGVIHVIDAVITPEKKHES